MDEAKGVEDVVEESAFAPPEPQQSNAAQAAAPAQAESKSNKDNIYSFDAAALEAVRDAKPWTTDPKYFKKVKISPSAAMKMLMHANSGVEKGIKQGGKPVEIMGMLLGRPADDGSRTLIVTDVFPLPIEGAETKVLADDDEVTNYMIDLGESLEATRKERFMGWYHSHPFEVEAHSHCFLSSTDLSTQLQWQRAEDPHGNPWLAIVVDPLRSLAKGVPEFGAFRVYPPDYTAPKNETPDGKIVLNDTARVERWGTCWNRYCVLEIEYFMSSLATDIIGTLTEKFLWMRTLATTPLLDTENREHLADKFSEVQSTLRSQGHDFSTLRSMYPGEPLASMAPSKDEQSALKRASATACSVASEHCQGQAAQLIKDAVFNRKAKQNAPKTKAVYQAAAQMDVEAQLDV